MKYLRNLIILFMVIAVTGCSTETAPTIETKKELLNGYREDVRQLQLKINALESEIQLLDPNYFNGSTTLVSAVPVEKKTFIHKIEVRATVESRKNILMSSELMGNILEIKVKEGDMVRAGQSLLTIDAESLRDNIDEIKTNLELANIIYKRQANLWENKIGTEIQYLEAKNKKEALEKRLKSANTQLGKSNIKAPFTGSIEDVIAREGEMAQPGAPLFRLVSLNDMYLNAEVSERYVGKFKTGDNVEVRFPSLDREFESKVTAIGQVINSQNRTFTLEIQLPDNNRLFKPNLTSVVNLVDYVRDDAVVIPTELIQQDTKGDFVFRINESDGKHTVVKQHIIKGNSFELESEINSGLEGNEILVDQGYREVTQGTVVRIASN